MRLCFLPVLTAIWLSIASPALAQFKQIGDTEGPKLGEARTSQWRIGMTIRGVGGVCRGGAGYTSVPADWPEQEVKVVEEEASPSIKVHYTTIEGGVKVMNLKIGQINGGQEAKAVTTFEVRRSVILPPDDTDVYVLPDLKKLPREIRMYLAPSPKIEVRDAKIRALAKEVGADQEKAWDRVEAIFDWVRDHVKYQTGELKGALAALKDGTGDCEGMTSLFIAICRAADIPARTVWVPGHCYPEFYLQDADGKGHWFPCQIAGSREFGGITETRPIFQKGDNIRPPINNKERRRYLDFDLAITGNVRPQVTPIREAVAK